MQRTYQSKKGGLDPREILLSLDDKTSAFDAFYIKNIKQTKRELSCMGSENNIAANRVRKRKYVKRIVKEVEPVFCESSQSKYLTPDKSLHVNRGDLFDQLLNSSTPRLQKPGDLFDQLRNSSPPCQQRPAPTNKDDLFDKLLGSKVKTNHRKKTSRAKKYNYSSSDSFDTDKENGNEVDFGQHELIIEKKKKSSLINQNESINQIVENISLINNIRKMQTPRSSVKKTALYRNRLTKNLPSPNANNSPLCSTPFVEKYRGKSIYNFSPIAIADLNNSKDSEVENANKINQSVTLVENEILPEVLRVCDESKDPSPVLKCSFKSHRTNSSRHSNVSQRKKWSKNSLKESPTNKIEEVADNKVMRKQDESLLQSCTKITPFLDHSSESMNLQEVTIWKEHNDEKSSEVNNLSPRKSLVLQKPRRCFGGQKKKRSRSSIKENKSLQPEKSEELNDLFDDDETTPECSAIQLSVLQEPFLGFSDIAEVSTLDKDIRIRTEKTMVENADPQTPNMLYEGNKSHIIENEECSQDETSQSQYNSVYFDGNKSSKTSIYAERESLYDTCNSFEVESDISTTEDSVTKVKKPVIILEKLNNSTFHKYYDKMTEFYHLTSSTESEDSYQYQNAKSDQDIFLKDDEDNTIVNVDQNEAVSLHATIQIDSEETTDSQSNDEEKGISFVTTRRRKSEQISDPQSHIEKKCFSFVTTRRRNEITSDSLVVVLDNSGASTSSSDGDKTILSKSTYNTKEDQPNNKTIPSQESSIVDIEAELLSLPKVLISDRNSITLRESSSPPDRDSFEQLEVTRLDTTEMKPTIVLQPGKKWQRSLSIYRRMTMLSDCSLLDDEDLIQRGRKYRESIINTMELQEHKGPLHNESFSSCRNSIISKPHRATVKILKEPNSSRLSLHTTATFDDLSGFLHEDCDDTVIEFSKLSIGDPEHEGTIVEKVHEDREASARDSVLRRCNQTVPILFDECYPDTVLKNCHKIGEGVYGEVFLWKARDGARVMKVVPVAGSIKVNGETQKDFHEIISEIVIAMELSALRAPIAEIEAHFDESKDGETLDLHTIENATDCFNEVLAVRLVQGAYPSRLLDLWDLYDESKGSENDNPAVLPVDQQYIVLELANAGQDLESYQFSSAEQAYALFLQVAFSLAVGEEAFQFEHRDLHWGNVLILPTEQKYATFVLRGRSHRVLRRGVAATIIDYSLSRLSLPLCPGSSAALYNDLATDDGLFDAAGDYQFEVYRLMRDKLGNEWENFEPYTNILWLHYTVDKMITALRYKRTNTKLHKHYINKLKGVKNRILDYGSAVQFVLTDNEF